MVDNIIIKMNLKTYTTNYIIETEYWEDAEPSLIYAQKYGLGFAIMAIMLFSIITRNLYKRGINVIVTTTLWLLTFAICAAYYGKFCGRITAGQFINGLNVTDPPLTGYVECVLNGEASICIEVYIYSYLEAGSLYAQTKITRLFLNLDDLPPTPPPTNVTFAPWNITLSKPMDKGYELFIIGLVMNFLLNLICIIYILVER